MTRTTDIVDIDGNVLVLILAGHESVDDPLGARIKIRNILYERYGHIPLQGDAIFDDVYIPSSSFVHLMKRQGIKIAIQTLLQWYERGYIRGMRKNRAECGYGGGGVVNCYHALDVYDEYYKARKGRKVRTSGWSVKRLIQEYDDGIGS